MSGVKYLYIDYISFNDEDRDRIAIQHVPPEFYSVPASYTCWFYSKPKLYQYMKQHYHLVYNFIADPYKYYIQLKPRDYEGQLWKLKLYLNATIYQVLLAQQHNRLPLRLMP